MKRETPSQWFINTFAAINYAAAVALRDQIASSSQRDDPADAATELTRNYQNHGHYQEDTR